MGHGELACKWSCRMRGDVFGSESWLEITVSLIFNNFLKNSVPPVPPNVKMDDDIYKVLVLISSINS